MYELPLEQNFHRKYRSRQGIGTDHLFDAFAVTLAINVSTGYYYKLLLLLLLLYVLSRRNMFLQLLLLFYKILLIFSWLLDQLRRGRNKGN